MKTGLLHILRNFSVKTDDMDSNIKYQKSPVALRFENANFQFVLREKRLENE